MDLSSLAGEPGWTRSLQAVGFDDAALAAGDTRARWLTSIERTGAELQALSPTTVVELCKLWPGELTIEVLLGTQTQMVLNRADAHQHLASLSATARYRVQLLLDKQAVLGRLGASADVVRWYASPQSQDAMLELPHPAVERDWFGTSEVAVVVVTEAEVRLAGPCLTIVGGSALDDVPVPQPDPDTLSVILRQLDWRRNAIWEDEEFAYVVPTQLQLEGHGWETCVGRLASAMTARQLLLFTADRVRRGPAPGAVSGEYHGTAGTVTIDLPGPRPELPEVMAQRAHLLVRWLFAEEPDRRVWLDDRVALLRTVVFENIRRAADAERSKVFVESMPQLLADVQWHWRLFISGELEDHVAAVDAFRMDVSEAVDSFTTATTKVVDSTIDGMKGAVATVIGSFIGAALATDFKETVFRVGMGVYAVYIVAFPGVFGLWSKYEAYVSANSSFQLARGNAAEILGEERVTAIEAGRPNRACKGFWTVFIASAAIFVAVAVAALIAQRMIPSRI